MPRNLKVWLDDVRTIPHGYNYWARDSVRAITLLRTGKVIHMSFDHDLGGDDTTYPIKNTGYVVSEHVEKQLGAFLYNIDIGLPIPRFTWDIHSANPPGSDKIKSALDSCHKLWDKLQTHPIPLDFIPSTYFIGGKKTLFEINLHDRLRNYMRGKTVPVGGFYTGDVLEWIEYEQIDSLFSYIFNLRNTGDKR